MKLSSNQRIIFALFYIHIISGSDGRCRVLPRSCRTDSRKVFSASYNALPTKTRTRHQQHTSIQVSYKKKNESHDLISLLTGIKKLVQKICFTDIERGGCEHSPCGRPGVDCQRFFRLVVLWRSLL